MAPHCFPWALHLAFKGLLTKAGVASADRQAGAQGLMPFIFKVFSFAGRMFLPYCSSVQLSELVSISLKCWC